MTKDIKTILSVLIGLFPALFFSQEIKQMTANEVAELALQNHYQLKVSAQNINIAKQQTVCRQKNLDFSLDSVFNI